MRKMKGDSFSQFSNKMSSKINKIMDDKILNGINIDEEYKLILEKKSRLSNNMREAITYQYLTKNASKEEVK
jgi:hypothetical protein